MQTISAPSLAQTAVFPCGFPAAWAPQTAVRLWECFDPEIVERKEWVDVALSVLRPSAWVAVANAAAYSMNPAVSEAWSRGGGDSDDGGGSEGDGVDSGKSLEDDGSVASSMDKGRSGGGDGGGESCLEFVAIHVCRGLLIGRGQSRRGVSRRGVTARMQAVVRAFTQQPEDDMRPEWSASRHGTHGSSGAGASDQRSLSRSSEHARGSHHLRSARSRNGHGGSSAGGWGSSSSSSSLNAAFIPPGSSSSGGGDDWAVSSSSSAPPPPMRYSAILNVQQKFRPDEEVRQEAYRC